MSLPVRQALELLNAALDGVEDAPTRELREALGLAKRLRSRVELYETKAASVVARRKRHGDGGAGLLNQVSGRSRSESARNVRAGACIGCGAAPHQCEAHHIIPWACRGKTRIDNLVLVCWHCHDLIHDHNWKVIRSGDRYRLRPPNVGCHDELAAASSSVRRPAGPDSAADAQAPQAALLAGLTHRQPMLC